MNENCSLQILKLYAWEPSFEEKVSEIRGREIAILKKSAILQVRFFLIPFTIHNF